ncbi:MAG: alpha/beta hydrolase [Bacteroidetes bacterium]|nr:alpha/beta hydrolase [Fibrella sp.]
MKQLAISLLLWICGLSASAQTVERLWPGDAPGAMGTTEQDIPTMRIDRPAPGKANGTALIVFPGGGYEILAYNPARQKLFDWFTDRGITVFWLRYRLKNPKGPKYFYPAPMQDAQRAIRWVRHHATRYGINSAKVGIIGSSAGGHLAAYTATRYDAGLATSPDSVERQPSRPDFSIIQYPVITFVDSAYAHRGSRVHLLGNQMKDSALTARLSAERFDTTAWAGRKPGLARPGPVFLVHGGQDTNVLPENSLLFYMALRRAKVPVELHTFETGKHGFTLAEETPLLSAWTTLAENWLRYWKFLE